MSMNIKDKIFVNGILKKYKLGDVYYDDLFNKANRSKYTSDELITYLLDSIDKKFTEESQLSTFLMAQSIYAIDIVIRGSDKTTLDIIKRGMMIRAHYQEYLITNNLDADAQILTSLEALEKTLSFFVIPEEELSFAEMEKLYQQALTEIDDLKDEIDKLDVEIESYKNEMTNSQKLLLKKDKTLKQKSETEMNLHNQKQKLEKKIQEITEKLKKENSEIANLKYDTKLKQQQIESLEKHQEEINKQFKDMEFKYKEQAQQVERIQAQLREQTSLLKEKQQLLNQAQDTIDNLVKENKQLTEQLIERNKNVKNTNSTLVQQEAEELNPEQLEDSKLLGQDHQKEIIKIILKYIKIGFSIQHLLEVCQEKKIKTSRDEVYKILKQLKTRIKITEASLGSFQPTYAIDINNSLTNLNFNIYPKENQDHINLFVISDLHIRNLNTNFVERFDQIYNYCAKHNIDTILNLGDIFDNKKRADYFTLDSLEKEEKLIDEMIKKIPHDPNIYQGFLGGNHEQRVLKFGIDQIQKLADGREDFINMGSRHATITLGTNVSSESNSLGLHHPDSSKIFILPDEYSNNCMVNTYLQNYYQDKTLAASYIDIFGHMHKSILDTKNNYCFVPHCQINQGYKDAGAWHLKVYLNEANQIENIIFIPVVFMDKPRAMGEINYQKKLSK